MSETTPPQPPDDASLVSIDEGCRAAFELAWLSGNRRRIRDCLPPESDPRFLPTLEELIAIEQELSWRAISTARGQTTIVNVSDTRAAAEAIPPVHVEDYCREFPVLGASQVVTRLIQQEFVVRQRFGDAPNVQEYVRRFPELSIHQVLSPENLLAYGAVYVDEPTRKLEVEHPVFPVVPGYDILGRLGSGGMGVVYKARQLAADRVVAIKMLRTDRLHELPPDVRRDTAERMGVEARATAQLTHPHVVGIFEVNTDDADSPWFSMQYVDGPTLSERLADGPVAPRTAAEFARQIADAITAAHARGILHRDLKPQNVFLNRDTEDVLVGDFGLAKLRLDDSRRTNSDDILGTPAYMSPEQIRDSSSVTESTDVWSIGATLYQLLTGRPPFQAASSMETLRQVLDHEPISPRELNPEVSRDLETICLKCLQKAPQRRYLTAEALERDLAACLSGHPIAARPISAAEKWLRWCRRNPLPASFAAVAVLSMLGAITALWIGYRTADAALVQATESLASERRALRESDASHRLARQTVDDLFTEVSETVLLNRPGTQPLRRRLLERTLRYYRRFADGDRQTSELLAETARVRYRIGRIESDLGHVSDAEAAYAEAARLQRSLMEHGEDPDLIEDLSTTLNAMGSLKLGLRQATQAKAFFDDALQLREQLTARFPDDAEYQRLTANTIMNLGAVHRRSADYAMALTHFRDAERRQRAMLAQSDDEFPQRDLVRRGLAEALYNQANCAIDQDATASDEDVLKPLREASELFSTLLAEQSDHYNDRRRLVLCLQLQAEAAPDLEAALASAEDAVAQMAQLVAENRAVPELVVELAQLELLQGRLLVDLRRTEEALGIFQQGITRLHRIPEGTSTHVQRDLAVLAAEAALAEWQISPQHAAPKLRDALTQLDGGLAEFADDADFEDLHRQLRECLLNVQP